MEIQSSLANQTAQSAAPAEKKTALTSDYEMFLQMLTTQMTNQDPLNPVDSSDYAVQLATFSSVEQQVLTNELLTELTDRLGGTGLADLGAWVGREVRSVASAYLDGSPITVATDSPPDAATTDVLVYDENQTLVRVFSVDTSATTAQWDGKLQDGSNAEIGLYDFRLRSTDARGQTSDAFAESYSKITEAKRADAGTVLVLEGGSEVSVDAVTAVRQ